MAGALVEVRRALQDEAGGVTVLALLSLLLTVICLGFAIDATNLYRHQAMLRLTADAAAHAGASALARGATPEAAEAAAMELLALNMPDAPEGSLLADRSRDLRALVVSPVDGSLSKPDPDTPPNAVLVSLQRSETARNPIPTFVLGLFGVDSWSTGTSSVAMVAPTSRCSNAAGLYAQGPISIGSKGNGAAPGDGICLHSQQSMSLPTEDDQSAAPPRLSLPRRTACKGAACDGAAEVNLIMPDIAAHVGRQAKVFADPGLKSLGKASFFANRPISKDLEPLLEVGVQVRGLRTGSVVKLSPFRFRLLREVPKGLAYLVLCGQPGAEVEPGAEEGIVLGEWSESPVLRDVALITSCPIRLGEHASIEGALIVSTAADSGLATAHPAARIGDPADSCDASRRSVLMSTGNLALPSSLTSSNIAIVAGGDVTLGLGRSGSKLQSRGIAVHAAGKIIGNGAQSFQPCPGAADPLLPDLRVIRHTMPPVEGWVTPVFAEDGPRLPGRPAVDLQLQRAGS